MSKQSFRVYLITHLDGRVTGILLRTWSSFFDRPAPSAYGISEGDVLDQLDEQLQAMVATGSDEIERYLWDEDLGVRTITVEVHPQSSVKKRAVIGKRRVPLRLTYLYAEIKGGGFRVMLPRFGWQFILESLTIAEDVLRQAVSSALLGESARSLYDFRTEGDESVRPWSPRVKDAAERASAAEEEFPVLRDVAEELVERAARGKLPPIFGESPELVQAESIFGRDPPGSILLVGEPGVGKTTWVYRMARRLLIWKREKTRRNVPRIWSTSTDRILAGMSYLGMWQERCLKLVGELSHEGDYLYVGPLLPLLRPQPDGSSIAELLAPALRSGEISLIAECTPGELPLAERRAASLLSCFHEVRLAEPELSSIPALIAEHEARKESRVRLHPAGKKRLVQHLAMFRRDMCFPGKALRFLDFLSQEAEGKEGKAPELYPRDVSAAYARYSGLPIELIADEIPASADALGEKLARAVIGQDRACASAARVLSRFKAGLDDPERPSGTLLFVGPTGVGKTELSRALCRTMFGDEGRMIRLDMSEYMLPGSAYRLLEVGPGSSSLAQRVRQEPLSLVLLDEIEKADREVLDVLLGILGEGRLTDEEGRLVDFRMTVIVMTSNLGASDGRSLGFGEVERGAALRKVRQHFRPELYNRIDQIVPFRALDRGDVLRIVDLELGKVEARTGLLRKNLRLSVSADAKAKIADLGYDPALGARPLKRVIEERVVTPIAAILAADAGFRDREIRVALREGELFVG
ncbi:MAG: AAA family ATPase [Byssovorax sp.]